MFTLSTSGQVSRANKDRACKCTKRACESQEETDNRRKKNRDTMSSRRASKSEVERAERLAANQQREADRRASESEVECAQRLAAYQQRGANYRASESETELTERFAANRQREATCRASESEAEHTQRLAAGQQREVNRRASESEVVRARLTATVISSESPIAELQNLMLNENTTYVATESVLLHSGQILVLEKCRNKGRMIILTQPGEGVQLGSVPMTDRGLLLMNSDRIFKVAK